LIAEAGQEQKIEIGELVRERANFLMGQLINVIPYVKELTGITEEARKVVEQEVAEFALSIKTSKLDRDQLEAFFKKPYYLEPVHGRPDSWYLVIPKFVDVQIGWLDRSTESYNRFLINRYMDWLGEIPEAIKKQLDWKPPPELVLEGEELHGPKGALEYAWQKYRPFLHDRDEKRIKINPKRAFDLIAGLIKDGVLPFSIKQVDPADLVERKCDFQLRDYQLQAWNELKRFSAVGVYYPPGTGKTIIGLWTMTHLKPPHLIVVPTRLLQEQWIERIEANTDLKPGEYEVLTYQGAISKGSNKTWSTLIIDEVHHLPANTFIKLSLIRRKYTLGLSATPFREDGREEYVFALSGKPVGLSWDYFKKLNLIKNPTCHVWIVKNFEAKLRRLEALLQAEKRTIIFSDSLEVGKAIANRFKVPFVSGETKNNMETIVSNRIVVVSRVGDEGMSLPDIEQVIEVSWLGGCYDEETEVLTETGWKYFRDIISEDKIATRGIHHVEYHHPEAIQKYEYSGKMIHFNGRSYDLLVTPNHRMYVRLPRRPFKFVEAQVLASKPLGTLQSIEFVRDGYWNGNDRSVFELPQLAQTPWIKEKIQKYNQAMKLSNEGKSATEIAELIGASYFTVNNWIRHGASPANKQFRAKSKDYISMLPFLKLYAWYISEGSLDHGRAVKIAQSDGPHKIEIAECVAGCGFTPVGRKDAIIIYSKQLAQEFKPLGHAEDKFIPRWILQLPRDYLRVFLETLLKGNGSDGRRYYTSSKRLADDVQELCLRYGYSATISIKKKKKVPSIRGREIKSVFPSYEVNISYKQLTPQIWKKPVEVYYSGSVYCVTVPNSLVLARRNGKAIWCGNSRRQELQRTTRLLHSHTDEQENHVLMTLEEYLRDRKRLFSIMDKGFKIVLHREGVSEKVIEEHSHDVHAPIRPRVSNSVKEQKTDIAPPVMSGQSATYTNLPGVQRIMALMNKKEQQLFTLLLDHDGEWFSRQRLPLLLGYASIDTMRHSIDFVVMVDRGWIEEQRQGKGSSYRTNMKGKMSG